MFAESCSVLDAVTVATLALLGLTDREICDAADSGGKGATDLLGNIAEPKQAEASEFVRKIVAASGVDLLAAKAAAAAAKLPPTPPESADSMRERRESNISNTSTQCTSKHGVPPMQPITSPEGDGEACAAN